MVRAPEQGAGADSHHPSSAGQAAAKRQLGASSFAVGQSSGSEGEQVGIGQHLRERSADEVSRIRSEAISLYDDGAGGLDLAALANPPKLSRQRQPRQLELAPGDTSLTDI